MEVRLSPAPGFDYANATARIYGDGKQPISWVSFANVAEMCVTALPSSVAPSRIDQLRCDVLKVLRRVKLCR